MRQREELRLITTRDDFMPPPPPPSQPSLVDEQQEAETTNVMNAAHALLSLTPTIRSSDSTTTSNKKHSPTKSAFFAPIPKKLRRHHNQYYLVPATGRQRNGDHYPSRKIRMPLPSPPPPPPPPLPTVPNNSYYYERQPYAPTYHHYYYYHHHTPPPPLPPQPVYLKRIVDGPPPPPPYDSWSYHAPSPPSPSTSTTSEAVVTWSSSSASSCASSSRWESNCLDSDQSVTSTVTVSHEQRQQHQPPSPQHFSTQSQTIQQQKHQQQPSKQTHQVIQSSSRRESNCRDSEQSVTSTVTVSHEQRQQHQTPSPQHFSSSQRQTIQQQKHQQQPSKQTHQVIKQGGAGTGEQTVGTESAEEGMVLEKADENDDSNNKDKNSDEELSSCDFYHGSVSLSVDDDDESLSPLHCFIRRYCVEAFTATAEHISSPRYGKSQGRSIMAGQVGIQCLHCKHRPYYQREERAICFPSSLKNIYHSIETWQRRHSAVCKDIPSWIKVSVLELMKTSKCGAGGRRKFWEESAARLGMANTGRGIRFIRPPGDLPPLSSMPPPLRPPPPSVHDDGSSWQQNDDDDNNNNNIIIIKDSGQQQGSSSYRRGIPVVGGDDRTLVTACLYKMMEQMETCQFTHDDRSGGRSKVKDCPIGFPGMQCKHCTGKAGFGRYFPTSVEALASANSDRNIFNHLIKCRRCPAAVREELQQLQSQQANSKNRRGSRKLFFQRVWDRLHCQHSKGDETNNNKIDNDDGERSNHTVHCV